MYTNPNQEQSNQSLKSAINEAERNIIIETLYRFGNHIDGKKKAAEALEIPLATLYNKLKKLNIDQKKP